VTGFEAAPDGRRPAARVRTAHDAAGAGSSLCGSVSDERRLRCAETAGLRPHADAPKPDSLKRTAVGKEQSEDWRMHFSDSMEWIAKAFEAVGVAIIALGGAVALARSFSRQARHTSYFDRARRRFGRPLLLGLEVLVAADVIKTVTVDSSLESVAALGILVLVRVLLSFTLDVELDGVLPWRRTEQEATLPEPRRAPSA